MIYDVTNYLLFTNPVSRGVTAVGMNLGKLTGIVANQPSAVVVQPRPISLPSLHALIAGRGILYMRLGALSGAAAVGMHLYYLHRKQLESLTRNKDYHRDEELDEEQQRAFETTNLFHFVHSVVLLSVPLMRMPIFTGSMLVVGTVLFAGCGYYRSLGGRRNVSALTGSGSCCLLVAWISMLA